MLHSSGQNKKWPMNGPSGYITPVFWGVPNASESGTKTEMAHKWAGGYITTVVCGAPMLQRRAQNKKWRTNEPRGFITPPIWGIPNASKRGTKSKASHKWAWWQDHGGALSSLLYATPPQ